MAFLKFVYQFILQMQILVQAFVGKPFTLEIQPTDDIMLLKRKIEENIMIPPDEQCLKVGKKRIEEIEEIFNCLKYNGSRVPILRVVHDRGVHRDSVWSAFRESILCISPMMPFGFVVTFPDIHSFY
jgi:hypothetical protein